MNNQKGILGASSVMQKEKVDSQTELCPHLKSCNMIQHDHEKFPELIERFKQNYCLQKHHRCSRRWIWDFLGFEKVPELMMPHQHDWAQQVLIDTGIGYNTFREKFPKP